MKRTIRLTEADLRRVVRQAVNEWNEEYQGNDLDYETIKMEAEGVIPRMESSGKALSWRSVAREMGFRLGTLNGDDMELLKDAIEDAMAENFNESVGVRRGLAESRLAGMISEAVNDAISGAWRSDADIHRDYEGFKINEFRIKPMRLSYSGEYIWDVGFEIEFPNVEHDEDHDFVLWDNPMVYDEKGERIAFDHWYPDDIASELRSMIRSQIRSHWPEMERLKGGAAD